MASTFFLAPSPKWYFADSFGKPASGGFMITRSSLDRSTPKFIFSDPAGLHPYDNPMRLDASGGTKCPMYWEDNEVDKYYLLVTDAFGNVVCEVDNYPIVGGGGVTPITTNVDIENHLINGQFLFIDAVDEASSVISPVPDNLIHIAPGGGYFKNTSGEYVRDMPASYKAGWCFSKEGGAGATDSISFVAVTNIGEGLPNQPSANATRFFRYSFSGVGAPVTDAALLDIIPNVERFSGEIITVSFETRSNVVANGVIEVLQYFGTGGTPTPSADVVTSQSFSFPVGNWTRQSLHISVPTVMGKIKGTNLDDAFILRLVFPLNTIGNFDADNLQIQSGSFGLLPYIQQTYAQDQFKVLIDLIEYGNILFKTGELKWVSVAFGGNPIDIPGWIPIANSNSITFIGKAGSPAFHAGEQFKNLYTKWWNSFPQSECNVATGRGLDANADFNAGKTMSAPLHIINTVLAGAGDGAFINASFGQFEGTRGLPISSAQGGTIFTTVSTNAPNNSMQPTFYLWLYVKL